MLPVFVVSAIPRFRVKLLVVLLSLLVFADFLTAARAASVDSPLFIAGEIKLIAPHAVPKFIDALVAAQKDLDNAKINTRLRPAHFIAQIATEAGGFRRVDENMNYSYPTL